MRNFKSVMIMVLLAVFCMVGVAVAADKVVEGKIASTSVGVGKNGAEYVRLILDNKKVLNGVEYSSGVPAMAFGSDLVTQAKMFKAGDNVKLIGSERDYQGRTSITILKFVSAPKAAK